MPVIELENVDHIDNTPRNGSVFRKEFNTTPIAGLPHHEHQTPECIAIYRKGTRVVSPCLKVLNPVRVIFSNEGQFGSGHLTKASVVIQSAWEVGRCFAARRGRTLAEM